MKTRGLGWIVLCVGLLGSGGAWAEEEAERVLKEIAEAMLRVDTLQEESVIKTEMILDGVEEILEHRLKFKFRRPNELVADMEYMRLVSDGETVRLSSTMTGRYMEWPVGESLQETLEDNGVYEMLQFWDTTRAWISNDPAAYLQKLKKHEFEILPDEEIDGAPHRVLRYGWGPMGADLMRVTAWIDHEYGLIRRCELRMKEGSDFHSDGETTLVRMVSEVASRQVNEPIADELFSHATVEQAKKVASMMDLFVGSVDADEIAWSRGAGLSRFELSGKEAPDFELELLDGSTFRLSEQRGNIVVLDFWATWCGPCVMALPDVKKLDEEYRDRGVVVVGVSRDHIGHERRVREMAEEKELDYAIGIDTTDVGGSYHVRGIPCVVVIDADGIVQGRKVGYSPAGMKALAEDIDRLLAGEKLDTARPMTEEEVKEMEEERTRRRPARRTTMDDRFFRAVWESDVRVSEHSGRFGNRIQVRMPPRTFTLAKGEQVLVLRSEDGKTMAEITLPPEARKANELRQRPTHLYVRHPDGGVVITAQQFMRAVEREGTTTSWRTERITVTAHDHDGEEIWAREFGENNYIQVLDTIPVSEEEDVLLLAFWNRFMLIDAQGDELLSQSVAHGDRIHIVREAANERILFYVSGALNACYELVLPESEPMIEIVSD